jgi:ABC-2 type transport system ATP-binding protein
MRPLVEIQGVVKRFRRKTVLEDVTLELEPGTVTTLLGPNGAGKSTLLRLILGVLRPDAGSVRVDGLDPVRDGARVRRAIGYVPDRCDAPGWMSARELFGFLAPRYPTWSAEHASELAARFALPLDTPLARLSLGQAAKAMLAAAFAPAPRLVLLDEPFSALDPLARNEFLRGCIAELAQPDCAALVATHDLDVAARIADRVVVLAEGRIATSGTVTDVLGDESGARLPQRLYELLESVDSPLPGKKVEVAA